MDDKTVKRIIAEELKHCDPQEAGVDSKADMILKALLKEEAAQKRSA